ncbi:MAG: CsgG/HfaB family protein [Nitrospirae bacterium]|nr:CsgG/HfaB family protein [Nitrospirota bacterium]
MSKRSLFLFVCVVAFLSSGFSYANDSSKSGYLLIAQAGQSDPVYQPYTGPKKRIAVTKFENKVTGVYGNWRLGDGFAEMLTTELMRTGKFVVVERQALQDVLGEQELGQSGAVRKETAAKVGQVLGAQIIVRGVVSEFTLNESGTGGGIGIAGFRIGGKSSNAHVAVDIRLVDTTTGQVLQSHSAVGKAESSGVSVGVSRGDVDFGAETFKNTPLGQATRQAIQDAVSFIIANMESVPFSAKVVKAEGNKIYINAGSQMNIHRGLKFYAYSVGEDIVDPDTGLKLGADEKLMGTVEVRDVQDKYSVGFLQSGSGLKRGDVLKLQ